MRDQPNTVYELGQVHDDPLYEGFAAADPTSLLGNRTIYDDFWPASTDWDWEAPRLAAIWRPLRLIGGERSISDYPALTLTHPVFSQRAVDALRDFLEPNGELLPAISARGTFWVYNVTTVAAALDHERSEIEWSFDEAWAFDIERFEFIPDALRGLTIFRPRELPNYWLVTDALVRRAREQGLRGMRFTKLWPLPPGELWQRSRGEELR